jgi:antitoxin ParD1/3/4
MPTRNVDLTVEQEQFIQTTIASGRFADASEVVREGLRLLEEREQDLQARIEWLRAAAQEGFDAIERGEYITLSSNEEIDAFMQEIWDEVEAEINAESRQRRVK